ncbi:hypothetical protein PR202_ga06645 [Eleusine coracana subsp. coracana]|uniref:RING-type domain-containing protein n=1 Tax=Eleusine coracana subsp. coracana TaxID=191504 RepID=A0AAV5BXZ3_ELECO|nr:hypothetical protein QOZ80_2AG0103600 [Eleusine coracana subsp. coracana]GJM90372.1 hypothetical protein PR202_ga06645 [Eleusine coracana subsp. coracana]
MAPPPTGADEPVPAAPAPGTEPPHHERDAKRPRPRPAAASAGARVLSLAVKAAVMAAALALFILFAAAAAILLLHLVVAARAFRHYRRSRYRVPSLDPSPTAALPLRAGLSPAELRRLPSFAFASTGGDSDGDASLTPSHLCAVCIEAGCAGERWRALPACGHAFHAACVDRWLAKSPACPICRAAVAVTLI